MLNIIEDKHVDVSPTKVYPLSQVDAAHAYLESGQSIGKVVVLV
jgi:NADPH:quinone reductase-like Zn-dependent oxidoreductase